MDTNPNADEQVKAQDQETATPVQQAETLESLQSGAAVPLAKYMAEKNAKRQAESELETLRSEVEGLKSKMAQGYSVQQTNDEVERLAQTHNVDPQFLANLIENVASTTKERIESEIAPALKELSDDKRTREFTQKFNSLVENAVKELPEYADLIDRNDLQDWATNPRYQKLSMVQLIEEKYGKYLPKKRPSEYSHSARDIEITDTSNPQTDADFEAMRKNPARKQEFLDELSKYL